MNETKSLFQAKDLIIYILKNWKTFLIVGAVSMILAIIFSGPSFIRPMYKSIATVYSTTTPSTSAALTVEDNPYRKNVLEFGEEENAEQMIQVLQSDYIKNTIIEEFDLGYHYWLDKNHEKYEAWLDNMYHDNISFKKNSNLAIEITVEDFEKKRAADIANRIVTLADEVLIKIKKDRAKEAMDVLSSYLHQIETEIDSINTLATAYMGEGYISADEQSKMLSEQLAVALRNNNKRGAESIREELKALGANAAKLYSYEQQIQHLSENLEITRKQYHNIQIDNLHKMSNLFIINNAVPAYKKHHPIRWLIVFGAGVVSIVITLTVLFLRDTIRDIKKQA
jgi:uncharacterized protein involved in exopolysaccharide biosynthesis